MVNIHEPGLLEGRLQWPILATAGSLEVRLAETEAEIEQAQRLRYHVFYEEMNAIASPEMRETRRDFDQYDEVCDHLLVVDRDAHDEDGQPKVVGTYRLTRDVDAAKVGGFYTAGEYNIAQMLNGMPAGSRFLELGRSCVLASYRTRPGSLQLLWKGVMTFVARFSCDLMFGCASLQGTDPDQLALQLSYLHHFHSMPGDIRAKARPELYTEMNRIPKDQIDPKEALFSLPPLLKGYIRCGAMIGDGAVVDKQFGTTDVLIYLPVASMDKRYRSRFGLSKA